MKAKISMIGDYENNTKTYAIYLIADESEVHMSNLKTGDEVEIVSINDNSKMQKQRLHENN